MGPAVLSAGDPSASRRPCVLRAHRFNGASGIKRWGRNGHITLPGTSLVPASMGPAVLSAGDGVPPQIPVILVPPRFNGASGIKRWGRNGCRRVVGTSQSGFNGASGIKRWGQLPAPRWEWSNRSFNGASGIKRWGHGIQSELSVTKTIGFNGASGIKRWGPRLKRHHKLDQLPRFNGASGIKRWGHRFLASDFAAPVAASMGPAVLSAGDDSQHSAYKAARDASMGPAVLSAGDTCFAMMGLRAA